MSVEVHPLLVLVGITGLFVGAGMVQASARPALRRIGAGIMVPGLLITLWTVVSCPFGNSVKGLCLSSLAAVSVGSVAASFVLGGIAPEMAPMIARWRSGLAVILVMMGGGLWCFY